MVLTLVLNLLYVFIAFILAILPASSALPAIVGDAFNYIFGFLWNFDNLVSVSLLFNLAALYVFFEASILLFDMVIWVIHLIRGK